MKNVQLNSSFNSGNMSMMVKNEISLKNKNSINLDLLSLKTMFLEDDCVSKQQFKSCYQDSKILSYLKLYLIFDFTLQCHKKILPHKPQYQCSNGLFFPLSNRRGG